MADQEQPDLEQPDQETSPEFEFESIYDGPVLDVEIDPTGIDPIEQESAPEIQQVEEEIFEGVKTDFGIDPDAELVQPADLVTDEPTATTPYIERQETDEEITASRNSAILEHEHQLRRVYETQGLEPEQIADRMKGHAAELYSATGGGSRLLSTDPTNIQFQTHLEAIELSRKETDTYFDRALSIFENDLAPEQMIQARNLIEQGIIEETDEAKLRISELQKEGKTEDEALEQTVKEFDEAGKQALQRNLTDYQKELRDLGLFEVTDDLINDATMAASVAGGIVGAKKMGKEMADWRVFKAFGMPGRALGALSGAAIGGAGGAVLSGMAMHQGMIGRFNYEPDDGPVETDFLRTRRNVQYQVGLAQAIIDDIGVVENIDTFLEVAPEAAKAELITRVMSAADSFGVTEKLRDMPSFTNFVRLGGGDPELVQEIVQDPEERPEVRGAALAKQEGITRFQGPLAGLTIAQLMYHPETRKYLRGMYEKAGLMEKEVQLMDFIQDATGFAAEFVYPGVIPDRDEEGVADRGLSGLLADMVNEVIATPEHREANQIARQQKIEELKERRELQARERKISFPEKDAIARIEAIDDGLIEQTEEDRSFHLNNFIDSHSYNTAHPDWRGDQPDVEIFRDFVKGHLKSGGRIDFPSDPLMSAAVESVRNGAPKEEIQPLLNQMSMKFLDQFRVKDIQVYKRPSIDDAETFLKGLTSKLQKESGRASSKQAQRDLQTLLFEKGYGTLYEPKMFQKLLGYAAIVPTAIAETDVVAPEPIKNLLIEAGLPYGTPAGMDFEEGLGLRPLSSDLLDRVKARRTSMTGGFQIGNEEVALARGYQRHSPEFQKLSGFGMVGDLLNVERGIIKASANAARMFTNVPSAGRAAFRTGSPRTRALMARNEFLANTSFDSTVDPIVAQHKLIKASAQEDVNSGIDPLTRLNAAEKDLFEDALLTSGRNPQEVFEAVGRAAKQGKAARKVSEKIRRSLGPNELLVLRADPEYKRLRNDVNNLVRSGKIDASDASQFMAMLEHQAIKIAEIPETPFKSAQEVIANLEIVTNRPAGVGARFMGKGLEEVDTATQHVFSQPLSRDSSYARIKAIMADIDVEEDSPQFLSYLEKKFNKKSLDELGENERIALKEDLFKGRIKPVKQQVVKVSPAKLKRLKERYKTDSAGGAPGPLTRKVSRKSGYKFDGVAKGTNTKNAAKGFADGDKHRELLKGRNPVIRNADWNQYWGGITDTTQVLEPPHKIRTYADPEQMAIELRKLTPEQKRRADTGIALVDQLGVLYTTGRAEANTTAQLLAWAILSRSLSAFPHESAFLDAFMNAPPASVFKSDFDSFIRRALDGEFDELTAAEFDIWIGGIHRRRAADDLLARGEISKADYDFFVGQNKQTVDSLVERGVITTDDAQKFLVEPLPKKPENDDFNDEVVKAMSYSRKLAESLRRKKIITDDEFRQLVGFHPALRVEGMGNPAAANLRAFGQNFLRQSSERLPEGQPLVGRGGNTFDFGGQTKLEAWHNILLNLDIDGQEARRLFHQIYQGSGIDNKVISFMLLAAGRKDVIVIDRIQANHFWGSAENMIGRKVLHKDGTPVDLYEGFGKPSSSAAFEKWAKNPRPYGTSRGLADVLSGARGALLYEAIEDLLSANMSEAYRLAGREGQGSLGRFHWETWVINSGQEVGHDTLNVILKQAEGFDDPAVGAFVSEGKFAMRRYGMKYAVLPNGEQAMVVATKDGENYLFTPESWGQVITKLEKDGANVGPGLDLPRVVPRGWRLTNEKFENTPWYHRASVDRDNLDIVIRKFGERATDEQNLALERFAGGAGSGRTKTPRVREAGVDEVEFIESTNYAAFEEAKNRNSRPENLAPKTMEEYEGSRVFMIESQNAGFLVKDGDLQNVFNNSGIPGLGTEILKIAIETYGARTLDCFDGFLPKYYHKAGFEEVARVPFVDEFAPPGWDFYKLGRPDIVIMAYRGGEPGMIRSNFGKFGEYERTNNRTTDFDAAQQLARRSVRDSGDTRGVEAVGAEPPRRVVGEESLRSRVGADKAPDSVEPTVIRLVDPESTDTKFQRKKGVPLGYFEYDQRTRIAIINLFDKGDLDTLWHENGHFMAALMGDKYKNTLFKMFDHEIDGTGSRKLTDLGHEQFAEAWRYYRRVRDNPNGYVRRLFDELWIALHNFWSMIRRKPGLLSPEVRLYWDLEFGELPRDRRSVQSATSGAAFKRPRTFMRTFDKSTGEIGDEAVSRAQQRVAKDLGFDEPAIRSLLGDRATRKVASRPSVQVSPGRQRRLERTVETTYEPRSYDAVDAGLEIYALIKNTDFRKRMMSIDSKTALVGTGRYKVSAKILSKLSENVAVRMTAALGESFEDLKARLYQPAEDGLNAIARRSTIPNGVTVADIVAFQKRLFAADPDIDAQKNRSSTTFLVLDDRQQAGIKVLLREIGNQPEADLIPFTLLDPDANLKLMSAKEMNIIRDVLEDILATPHNRRSRNLVDPGFFRRTAEIFADRETVSGIADVLQDMASFFTKRTKLEREGYDPKFVELLEAGGRYMLGSGEDLKRLANSQRFGTEDTLLNFVKHNFDLARPRVNLANLQNLQKIHEKLNGLVTKMDKDAESRIKSQVHLNAQKPVTRDPIRVSGDLDLKFLGRRLPVIQQLLDDVLGMNPVERDSVTVIQSLYDQVKRGRLASDFTDAERAVLADAIEVIHTAINQKHQHVTYMAKQIYEMSMAVQNIPEGAFAPGYAYTIYRHYYTGNFTELFAMTEALQNVRRGETASLRRSYNLGVLNNIVQLNFGALQRVAKVYRRKRKPLPGLFTKMLGKNLPTKEERLISLLMLLKMEEVKHRIAKDLVKYGYDTSRRTLVGNLDLSSSISYNRSKYVDRVQFYVNHMLGFTDVGIQNIDKKAKQAGKIKTVGKRLSPESPRNAKTGESGLSGEERYYGPTERKENFRLDPHIVTEMDRTAAFEAQKIVNRLGIKIGRGTLEVVSLGDREFYMPKNAVDFLEDYTLQNFPNTRFKKSWGEKGRAAYQLYGDQSNKAVQAISDVASTLATVTSYITSPRAFYAGLLIGTGGLPMVGYGMGVFVGGLSQLHFGRGVKAAIDAALDAPAELGEALPVLQSMSLAFREEIGFTAGVLSRLHGRGFAQPKTKPRILPNGKIITADMMTEAMRRHGVKSAFVDMLKNPDLVDSLHSRFSKTEPQYAMGALFAGLGAPYGLLSSALSGLLGFSVGTATKPGNIFARAHRAYAEIFSALDTYLRIKVINSFLDDGIELEDAARRTRDIMLDYSALSDPERNYISRYFAFWSYFSQANKLLFQTALENPDRIITQLKLIKSTQQTYTEGRDPEKFLSPWDQFRTLVPGLDARAPLLVGGDMVGLWAQVTDLGTALASPDASEDAISKATLAITSRLSPQIGLGVATAFRIDPGLGFPLDRATLQVPGEIVHWDELMFGRAFSDHLKVRYIEPKNIAYVYDQKDEQGRKKKRVNPRNIEHPSRGIWVSDSPVKYNFYMNYVQSPITGRMGDNLWAMSRANLGVTETVSDALEYVKVNYSPDQPIMSHFGVMNYLKFLGIDVPQRDPRRLPTIDDPIVESSEMLLTPLDVIEGVDRVDDQIRPGEQITTAPINLLEDRGFSFRNADGSFEVYTDKFYWTELGRVFGWTSMPGLDLERPVVMDKRRHYASSKESASKLKKSTDQAIMNGILFDLSKPPPESAD